MTLIGEGQEVSIGAPVDESLLGPTIGAAEIAVDAIMLSWHSFVPTINGRSFTTPVEQEAWNRMPPWQQNALRMKDEALQLEGPEVLTALSKKVAEDTARRTSEAINRKYTFYQS